MSGAIVSEKGDAWPAIVTTDTNRSIAWSVSPRRQGSYLDFLINVAWTLTLVVGACAAGAAAFRILRWGFIEP